MGGTFQATAGLQDSDSSEKAREMVLSVITHLSGFRLQAGPTHGFAMYGYFLKSGLEKVWKVTTQESKSEWTLCDYFLKCSVLELNIKTRVQICRWGCALHNI